MQVVGETRSAGRAVVVALGAGDPGSEIALDRNGGGSRRWGGVDLGAGVGNVSTDSEARRCRQAAALVGSGSGQNCCPVLGGSVGPGEAVTEVERAFSSARGGSRQAADAPAAVGG